MGLDCAKLICPRRSSPVSGTILRYRGPKQDAEHTSRRDGVLEPLMSSLEGPTPVQFTWLCVAQLPAPHIYSARVRVAQLKQRSSQLDALDAVNSLTGLGPDPVAGGN